YEVINTEILLRDLVVQDGELVLPGVGRYKVLSIGNEEAINTEALARLKELADAGAVIVGSKPVRSDGLNRQPQATETVIAAADRLWDTVSTRVPVKGKILSRVSPASALEQLNVPPDFIYPGQTSDVLDYIHYRRGDSDFYLIRNTTGNWVTKDISFRQTGKVPELWDPKSGSITGIGVYKVGDQHTTLPLSLAPYGSCFVVFSPGQAVSTFDSAEGENIRIYYTSNGFCLTGDDSAVLTKGEDRRTISVRSVTWPVEGEWRLTFPPDWGAPSEAVLPELISWTEHEDPGIRFFSGMASYHKTFTFDHTTGENERVFLDLGELAEAGEVWVNGESVGVTWTSPHRFDITAFVTKGVNDLKIEIGNTWSNRLTGDDLRGENYTQTNITVANKFVTPWKDLPLKRSGLFGPVKIEIVKTVR